MINSAFENYCIQRFTKQFLNNIQQFTIQYIFHINIILCDNVMGWCVAAFNNSQTEKCWSSIFFYKFPFYEMNFLNLKIWKHCKFWFKGLSLLLYIQNIWLSYGRWKLCFNYSRFVKNLILQFGHFSKRPYINGLP